MDVLLSTGKRTLLLPCHPTEIHENVYPLIRQLQFLLPICLSVAYLSIYCMLFVVYAQAYLCPIFIRDR